MFGITLLTGTTLPTAYRASEMAGMPADDCLPKYPPPPVLKINVRVPACSEPGRLIEYRICVENCSPAEAHHVLVKNALPSNAKFVKAEPAPSKLGTELQWNLGTIGGGAVREIILVLQPTNKEDVKNCARVQFEHGQCVVTRLSMLPPGARPPIISTVPDGPKPEEMPVIDVKITGAKEQYANLASKYEITLTNKGKTKALNTQVSARVPDQLKIVKASEPGVAAANVAAWNLGHLDPGATRILELTLRATDKGEFCFKVTAESDHGIHKETEFCTKFLGVSAMTIEMTDSEDPVFVGEKTSYPIVIRNQGTEPLTNIQIKALVPPELKFSRANAFFEKQVPIKEGQWLESAVLPRIEAGSEARYEIVVEAVRTGVTVFQVQISADQLDKGRPVTEQESTTVVDDREKMKQMSRKKTR